MQRRLMGIRDERSTAAMELLGGIKAVKMYAWECSFFSRISDIRERELHALRVYWRLMVASRAQWLGAPICVSIATFGCYVLLHGDLDAATAFTAIALFNILRFPMQLLPMTTNNTLEARVALTRIQTFLNQEEAQGLPPLITDKETQNATLTNINTTTTTPPHLGFRGEEDDGGEMEGGEKGLPAVEVEGASFVWPNGAPLLKDISFQCKRGGRIGFKYPVFIAFSPSSSRCDLFSSHSASTASFIIPHLYFLCFLATSTSFSPLFRFLPFIACSVIMCQANSLVSLGPRVQEKVGCSSHFSAAPSARLPAGGALEGPPRGALQGPPT